MIQQSLFYIETHLHEQIGLEEVASEALLSPYHYHRIFRNEVGMTVVDYIRNRRMSLGVHHPPIDGCGHFGHRSGLWF